MSKLVVDVIGAFVAGLKLESKVLSFSAPATIVVCDIFHARAGLYCLLDGEQYLITETDRDTGSITVQGYTESSPAVFSMPAPHYFHGTPTATGAEISRLRDADKVPMVYLLEIIRETIQSEDSAYASVADLRLFFLDVADYAKWTTDDHYAKCVEGLRSLVDAFIIQARRYRGFGKIAEIDLIAHVKFGVYQDSKDRANSSLFNERLTGIEMRASFPLRDCSLKHCN